MDAVEIDELTMKQVRPFWGRATVIESPVDEVQRQSGLVVPLVYDDDDLVIRGVVVDVDYEVHPDGTPSGIAASQISPGTVVYYRGGVRIADVVVIYLSDILAYEG